MKIWTKITHNLGLGHFLLALLFVTIPLKNSLNTFVLILITIYAVYNIKNFKTSHFKLYYGFFIFYALVILSLLYTENIGLGFRYIEKYSICLIVPFILSTIKIEKEFIFQILILFSLVIIVLILYCEFHLIKEMVLREDSISQIFNKRYSYLNFSKPVDIHPAYFSLFIITSILTIFHVLISSPHKKPLKLIGIVLIAFLCLVIIQLANRTYLMVLLFVLNYCAFLYFNIIIKKKVHLALILLGVNLVFLIGSTQFGYTKKRIQQVFGYTYANGYKHEDGKKKLLQWSTAFDANKNFIIGNSLGDAKNSILEEYKKRGYSYYLKNSYNAHNQYLETFVGLGVMGLFSLLLIIYQGVRGSLKHSIGPYRILYFIIPIVFITESYLERHHGLVFIVLIYALIILPPDRPERTRLIRDRK